MQVEAVFKAFKGNQRKLFEMKSMKLRILV